MPRARKLYGGMEDSEAALPSSHPRVLRYNKKLHAGEKYVGATDVAEAPNVILLATPRARGAWTHYYLKDKGELFFVNNFLSVQNKCWIPLPKKNLRS